MKAPTEAPASLGAGAPSAAHQRRLHEVWRSAGWPCKDNIELDLLAAGLLARHWDLQGRETLRLTEAGLQLLAAKRKRHQQALSAHETLVAQVVLQQQRAGRVVWRGLSLRAPLLALADPSAPSAQAASADAAALLDAEVPTNLEPHAAPAINWAMAMPDVYAIRHTTVEDYLSPVAFEIKVSRADLLSDLRRPAKAAAYLALASQCWYVLRAGIARPEEIPPAYGVMEGWVPGMLPAATRHEGPALQVLRPAPARALRLPFSVWMALARANAEPPPDAAVQTFF